MAHPTTELEQLGQLIDEAFDESLGGRPGLAESTADVAEYFVTRILPGMREGHEILTRAAASGLAGVDLPALLRGVVRVDAGMSLLHLPGALLGSLNPAQQRRHSLRASPCQSVAAALRDIRRHLALLHVRALAATARPQAFEQIGEALHLIQDSYSEAHVERTFGVGPGGTHPIRYIRFFGFLSRFPPRFTSAPREHAFPSDPRDQVTDSRGRLKRESILAISASREYLQMMLRHLASPRSPRNLAELRSFINRHLALSARPLDVRSFHPECRESSPTGPVRPPVIPPRPPVVPTGRTAVLDRFGFDQSVLTTTHRLVLDQMARSIVASWLTPRPIRTVRLVGHTDSSGADAYNLQLGQRRRADGSAGAEDRSRPSEAGTRGADSLPAPKPGGATACGQ